MKQKGFTIVELLCVIVAVSIIAACGGALYVLGHFIAKFW